MSEPKSLWAQHIEDACPEGPFPPEESTRHPKWKAVPPGTVIPAGQPIRFEYDDGPDYTAMEKANKTTHDVQPGPNCTGLFIDSSWKPPLALPTEPTWGITVTKGGYFGKWWLEPIEGRFYDESRGTFAQASNVQDFIPVPLTDEQVQRIEAAR